MMRAITVQSGRTENKAFSVQRIEAKRCSEDNVSIIKKKKKTEAKENEKGFLDHHVVVHELPHVHTHILQGKQSLPPYTKIIIGS